MTLHSQQVSPKSVILF